MRVNILGLAGYIFSVIITQFYYYSAKTAIGGKNKWMDVAMLQENCIYPNR